MLFGLVALAVAVLAGFVWFVDRVNDFTAEATPSADGVVVLTGGRERIADAVDLLAAGRGKRLLITGVNPVTRMQELARQRPQYAPVFSCCVDIDRSATNTVGNAIETRKWAQPRNFHSLIVVTSDYHMPRAMAELTHQLPDVTLIPYAVVTEHPMSDPWWTHLITARTLAIEYVKYVAAVLRTRLEPNPSAGEIAAVRVGDRN
jgi:uncharacterized SAM-binding protein YcdF (DUF218 family)